MWRIVQRQSPGCERRLLEGGESCHHRVYWAKPGTERDVKDGGQVWLACPPFLQW